MNRRLTKYICVSQIEDKNVIIENIKKESKSNKKGFRNVVTGIKYGLQGEDFLNETMSVLIYYKEYKKPRFIK